VTEPSHLAALYNAAEIIVWVEDLVTSAYLGEIWGHDARFKFYIGGGHENLAAVVEYARRSGRSHVFSVRDRDFGPTNRSGWRSPDVFNLALETFEVECFLLDPAALAACAVNTAGRTEPEIRARIERLAGDLLWWMACRSVIAGLREARQAKFPGHPKYAAITSRADAERVLLESEWVTNTVPDLTARVAPATLRSSLDAAHEGYARRLATGGWEGAFSGKELINPLVSWVYTRGRPRAGAGLEDLAKAVAREQTSVGRAPAELLELRDALLARRSA
jgi:hypothetical protein